MDSRTPIAADGHGAAVTARGPDGTAPDGDGAAVAAADAGLASAALGSQAAGAVDGDIAAAAHLQPRPFGACQGILAGKGEENAGIAADRKGRSRADVHIVQRDIISAAARACRYGDGVGRLHAVADNPVGARLSKGNRALYQVQDLLLPIIRCRREDTDRRQHQHKQKSESTFSHCRFALSSMESVMVFRILFINMNSILPLPEMSTSAPRRQSLPPPVGPARPLPSVRPHKVFPRPAPHFGALSASPGLDAVRAVRYNVHHN